MPWAVLIIGATVLVTAYQGTEDAFFNQLKSDILGSNGNGKGGFLYWIVAIAIVGGLGYIPGFKPLSNAFLILLLVVLFLTQSKGGTGGFFSQFQNQLNSVASQQTTTTPTNTTALGGLPALPTLPQFNALP
jgi:hypothetical protein